MHTLEFANLTCPHCLQKQTIDLKKYDSPKKITCIHCGLEIQKSEQTCCVICEYSDLFCLPKQNIGSCSW